MYFTVSLEKFRSLDDKIDLAGYSYNKAVAMSNSCMHYCGAISLNLPRAKRITKVEAFILTTSFLNLQNDGKFCKCAERYFLCAKKITQNYSGKIRL